MRALAGAALVAALMLSACTSEDSPSAGESGTGSDSGPATGTTSPSDTPEPPPAPPAVGACYRLSYDEAIAPTSADGPVSCDKGHTSQTFAVGQLDLVVNGHLLAVDSDEVREQVAKRCPGQLAAYVGATTEQLRLSLLRPVWFTPTIEQADAGATWYRCDVIAVTGDKTVAKIDRDISGALKKPDGRTEFGMCGTARPGTEAFSRVLCRDDHSWKAISVVDLAGKSKDGSYPGPKVVKDAGENGTCADAARAIASDALDYEWGYEWPTKDQWDAGQTYGRCWSPDPA
jgi:hypothetical protein